MTTTIQLTSTQSEVLRHAIENTADKVTWFPEQLKGGARTKVIQALEHKGLVIGSCDNWQVTDTAYEALGLTRAKTKPSRANSKQARIVEMLRRPEGATIQQLMDALIHGLLLCQIDKLTDEMLYHASLVAHHRDRPPFWVLRTVFAAIDDLAAPAP